MRRRLTRLPLLPEKFAWNTDRLVNRFIDFPAWLRHRRDDYDVFHLIDHSYSQLVHGLQGKPVVVTCHDLDTFRCLLEPERERRPRWFRAMTRRILDGFLKADRVIAVSAATRDELLRHRLFRPEQVSVVPNGVHPCYSAAPNSAGDIAAANLLPREPHSIWLLNVGSTLPRKRLDLLLRVFAEIRRDIPEVRLVRAGGGFTSKQFDLARELGVEDAIVVLPFLEREVLAAVYRRANLLLHTAEAEGFGLPLVEAMACGCPVVASDLAVLREVGGNAAMYCELGNVEAWRRTVIGLLRGASDRDSAWQRQRQCGLARGDRFSWAANARQTAAIYQELMEVKTGN